MNLLKSTNYRKQLALVEFRIWIREESLCNGIICLPFLVIWKIFNFKSTKFYQSLLPLKVVQNTHQDVRDNVFLNVTMKF